MTISNLQVELRKQSQTVLRRLVRTAPEGFVDDDETEGARTHRAPFQAELIGQAGGQDGVGQLLLLPARLAARIRVVLVLAVVLAPALAGGKQEPVAHISDLRRPAPVLLRQSLAPAEALDDRFDLQKLGFGILLIVRAGQRAFGTGPQLGSGSPGSRRPGLACASSTI